MNGLAKVWVAVAIASVVGVAVGASAVWVARQRQIDAVELRLERATAELQNARAEIEATTPAAPEPTAHSTETPTTPDLTATVVPKNTTKEFAFIKEVSSSKREIVADYAQFLTGDAAADAAKKVGAESPPPNDYFIVNENPRLRTLPVLPAVSVRLTMDDEGLSEPNGYAGSLAQLGKQLTANPDQTTYRGFWLTLKDGVVFRIDEQFTP